MGFMAMAMADRKRAQEQARAVFGAALVHALLASALLMGLRAGVPAALDRPLALFRILPPPEADTRPPPPRRRATDADRARPGREGAASPLGLRSQASEIVAPRPAIPLPPMSPMVAAPSPGTGSDPSSGAASVRGPGEGDGGEGDGGGSGWGGDGDGGGGYGPETPPRHVRGRLRNSDYPVAAGEAGAGGTVSVRFTVALDGRAVDCRITGSSGSRLLDATTCRLIEQRYRFDPSRDGRGRPVRADVVEDHHWMVRDEAPARRRRD